MAAFFSVNEREGICLASRAVRPIFQPSLPGGGSPTRMSPLALTIVRWKISGLEHGQRFVGGVTLRDAAEVEVHAGPGELHAAALGLHVLPTDGRQRHFQLRFLGAFFCRRACRHNRVSGPTVTSNAPPVA